MNITENRFIIDEGMKSLNNILRNLNKAPNRKYRQFTLKQKLNHAKLNYGRITDALAKIETVIEESELLFLTKGARQVYSDIHILISTKLEFAAIHEISIFSLGYAILFINKLKSKISPKMAKVDIKTGATLIHVYDGNPTNLDTFLDSVALFADLVDNDNAAASQDVKNAAKATALRFIKTRLTEAARQAIPENATLDQLIDALKANCSPKTTADNVLAKLKSTRQSTSAEAFCTEVEKLTQELKTIYIRNRIPADVATQMATKSGVDALIAGTKNSETKTILRAGMFTKINDAIQKLHENDATQKVQGSHSEDRAKSSNGIQAQMFMANRNQYRGRGRGSNLNYGRGNYNSYNRYGGNWRNNNFNHPQHYQPRFQNTRGQGNYRGQWNHRGRPSIYLMQPNPQMMNQSVQQQPLAQQMQQNTQQSIMPNQNLQNNQTQMPNQHFLGTPFGR